MLSPVECYIKSKENELKLKTEEVMEKKRELETITDQIKIVNILSRKVHVKLNFKCLMTNHAMPDTQSEHASASCVQTQMQETVVTGTNFWLILLRRKYM